MKSWFNFSAKQRNGLLLLVGLIIVAQLGYHFFDFSNKDFSYNDIDIQRYQTQMDSLRGLEVETKKPKIYPFNPNFITDYKGYTLGMSNAEIDRLHQYRAGNKWVNSAKEFQSVTKVSDSLLAVISPYFKFPEWVTNPRKNNSYSNRKTNSRDKSYNEKIDLNTATAFQLQKVFGVGEKLSQRIVDQRSKYKGGFNADVELSEVWGLSPEVIGRIKNDFTVKTPRAIDKLNINTATRDQLVLIPHIDYEIANNIIEERILREGFNSLDDLTKVEDFPLNKIEIIKLYLLL